MKKLALLASISLIAVGSISTAEAQWRGHGYYGGGYYHQHGGWNNGGALAAGLSGARFSAASRRRQPRTATGTRLMAMAIQLPATATRLRSPLTTKATTTRATTTRATIRQPIRSTSRVPCTGSVSELFMPSGSSRLGQRNVSFANQIAPLPRRVRRSRTALHPERIARPNDQRPLRSSARTLPTTASPIRRATSPRRQQHTLSRISEMVLL